MPVSVILGEDDLKSMPSELRVKLLAWYFDDRATAIPAAGQGGSPSGRIPQLDPPDLNIASRRITFPELVRAAMLHVGDEIHCRTLKRQQRKGLDSLIRGAKVTSDGRVEFQEARFSSPSKLAVAMLNANGGKVPASNGYEYLHVQTAHGLLPLSKLRERLITGDLAEEAEVQTLLEAGEFGGSRREALKWVRENRSKS
jgi:hypothetical protein